MDKRRIRAAFDRAAPVYESQAVLQREVCNRLLERLDYVKIAPRRILDAGSGPGLALPDLARRYRKAEITALDLSPAMLARTPRLGLLRRALPVCGDAEALPFADGSFDLIVSNLMIQWCDAAQALAAMRRVLAPNGLLMFTTFGPDTLRELRAAWAAVDDRRRVHDFLDMHDIGDIMLESGFDGPVMDREEITLTYGDAMAMMRDLKGIGATHPVTTARGLTGRAAFAAAARAYEQFRGGDGRLPATFEVIYGHAWAPDVPPPAGPEKVVQIHPVK